MCATDASGYPTSDCVALTPPGTFAAGTLSFTDPANTTLMMRTTYAVVATPAGTMEVGIAAADGEDMGFVAPWSIANEWDYLTTSAGGTWQTDTFGGGRSMRIAINGSAAGDTPTLSTDATLSPAFASGTATYTASVANSVDEVTVTPTTNHASPTVEILDTDDNELDDADDMEDDFQVGVRFVFQVRKARSPHLHPSPAPLSYPRILSPRLTMTGLFQRIPRAADPHKRGGFPNPPPPNNCSIFFPHKTVSEAG